MKIKLTIVAIAASASLVVAQNSRVVSAYNSLENYKRDKQGEPEALNKAKEYIDGVTEPETLGKPKTWFYRGNIYYEIGQSKNPMHTGLSPDPNFEAAVSYQKCVTLDPKYEFAPIARQQVRFCSAQILNKGVEYYSNKNYAGALDQFEKCIKIAEEGKAFDTLAVRNSILAAREGKNYDKAMFYINKMIDAKAGGANMYLELSRVNAAKGDTAAALKTLQEGRAKFGNDINLVIDELNYYLIKNDNVGAEKILKDAIVADPKNPSLYFAAGTVYSNLKNYDKAEENFKKSLELKPDYGDALFNLGVVYVSRGNDLLDKSNTLVDQRKFKEADDEKAKAMDQYKMAIEQIEKARLTIADPKKDADATTAYVMYVKALKDLYGKVENNDKYMEMKKILDEYKN